MNEQFVKHKHGQMVFCIQLGSVDDDLLCIYEWLIVTIHSRKETNKEAVESVTFQAFFSTFSNFFVLFYVIVSWVSLIHLVVCFLIYILISKLSQQLWNFNFVSNLKNN